MKSIASLILYSGYILSAFAQTSASDIELSSLIKFDLGGQGIGPTYESRLFNEITLDISAGVGGGYDITEGSLVLDYLKPAFYFSLTPKYFYNRQTRADKGKETRFNSGNYIGTRLKYAAPNHRNSDFTRNSILANLHWGIQRAIGRHWTFNFHIGAGYARDIDNGVGTIYPAIDFKFSYVFSNLTK
jgi:hypothetical protein